MPAPKLLTVDEVARRLCVGRRTVWRWSREGAMPAPVRFGPSRRTVRWKADDINYFLEHVLNTLPPFSLDGDDDPLPPPRRSR